MTGARRSGDVSADDRSTADGTRSSLTGVAVTLAAHHDGVAETDFASRLGFPDDLIADLRLAGEWHDAGKADPRFQRWLHGGSEFKALVQKEPLAKSPVRLTSRLAISRARERAGYPDGSRHELMSVALLKNAGDWLIDRARDRSLVAHLISSHHGHCRPLAPWAEDAPRQKN